MSCDHSNVLFACLINFSASSRTCDIRYSTSLQRACVTSLLRSLIPTDSATSLTVSPPQSAILPLKANRKSCKNGQVDDLWLDVAKFFSAAYRSGMLVDW